MDLTRNSHGNSFEVSLNGRLVFSENGAFRELVEELGEHHGKSLVLDVTKLEFIDSAGLGMLLIAKEEAEKNQMSMTVRGAQGQVREMFDISCFDSIISIE
tara:strand:+ start:137 stop:439 length:303 start_codon:yes stop_codon:yes gene_type:complete